MNNDENCVNLAYLLAYLQGTRKAYRKHSLTASAVKDKISKTKYVSPGRGSVGKRKQNAMRPKYGR